MNCDEHAATTCASPAIPGEGYAQPARDVFLRKNFPSVEMQISGNERIWRVGTATAMNNQQRIWSGRFDAVREYEKQGLQNRRLDVLWSGTPPGSKSSKVKGRATADLDPYQ